MHLQHLKDIKFKIFRRTAVSINFNVIYIFYNKIKIFNKNLKCCLLIYFDSMF